MLMFSGTHSTKGSMWADHAMLPAVAGENASLKWQLRNDMETKSEEKEKFTKER